MKMAVSNKNLSGFTTSLWLTLGMFVVFVIVFVIYVRAEKQIDFSNEQRQQSFLLADELRQSSDDLTRMVRTYVVTGNPIFKQHYQEILDIRDGKKPRPIDYNDIYWDLVMPDDQRPRSFGPAVPLLELMRQAGFTEQEFARLAQAKANSDTLTHTEFSAMALVESTEPTTEDNHLKAIELLYDASYHQAKYGIMQPISEFNRMMNQRTLKAVHAAKHIALLVRIVLCLFGLLLVFTLWRAYRALHSSLGCSVDELQQRIACLGRGDFSSPIPVSMDMENSVLGWLSEMRINLARIEADRNQAEMELRQSEERLKLFKDHLEEEVQQRTSDLIQARNAAEAANIAKSTFIATMSHELRTPLNAILGFSELMSQDETTTTNQKETLAIINRSGAHLLSMINDVLDISKIEVGRLDLDIQALDLINLLQDLGDMIRARAASKHLSFSLEIAIDTPQYIKVDGGKLRQVLINLLGNALKFTQQGEVVLRADAKPLTTDSTMMLGIEVADSGGGIAGDQQQELFKPFVQLGEKNADIMGTGLGLAISKSLVELMGGSIGVTSILGAGSIFRVELPVLIASSNDIAIEQQHPPVKGIAPGQSQWRLLVIDDSFDNRLLLVTLLTNVGFQVREAENGQEAIYMFEQWQPHLIWMDMRMPVMDGYEAIAKIRRLEGGNEVKIIALTASAFREQHAKIINAGCDAVLHKPFHAPDIFAALTEYLGVKFIYQDRPVPVSSPIAEPMVEMLDKLPLELRQQLHDAAVSLDSEETDTIIAKVRSLAPDVADALQELVKNFQFDRIIQLTGTTDTG